MVGDEMSNFSLSSKFDFYTLTTTNNFDLLIQNRKEAELFIDRLRALAIMLEILLPTTGPIEIHSGFRGPSLNKAVGGSKSSQHIKGEACDFSRIGIDSQADIDSLFEDCLSALISDGVSFGQLLKEGDDRGYSKKLWIHLSLGEPFRERLKCGQVATLINGKFDIIKVIPFGR